MILTQFLMQNHNISMFLSSGKAVLHKAWKVHFTVNVNLFSAN